MGNAQNMQQSATNQAPLLRRTEQGRSLTRTMLTGQKALMSGLCREAAELMVGPWL